MPAFAELPLTIVSLQQTGAMDANSVGGTVLFTEGDDELAVTSVHVLAAVLFGATICVDGSGDVLGSVCGVDEADVVTSDVE